MDLKNSSKILTIDDEAYIRNSIRTYLEDYGFQVVEADTGRTGIDVFDREEPDLVLLDLRMPEMDGLQVLEILRKRSPDTPLIVASGTGNIRAVVEALHLGAWDYILKPVQDMSVLYHSVTKCLKESRLQKENKEYQDRLEDLVRERTRKLKASEQEYKAVFECTGTATAILENDQTISMVNTRFERLSGLPREQIIGRKKWTDFVTPADLEKMKRYHELRRSKAPHDLPPEQYEFMFVRSSGEERYVLVDVGVIPGTDRSVASLLDITKRKKAEQRGRSLEKQLRKSQKMEAIGTLAGGIAHDLNNILSPVLGYADMIMRSSEPGGITFERSEKIQKAALRAADLVSQILSFSRRTEEGKRAVKIYPVLNEAVRLLRGTIPSTIRIIDQIDRTCGLVEADPTQIHQVIMNLCTNSYHAMQSTGGELLVSLFPVEIPVDGSSDYPGLAPGHFLCLSVEDTGCGMPEEVLERIFDPYFTTKEEGKGTGLGLATVYSIVKSCQGEIIVKSTPGQGSCFKVMLPVVGAASGSDTRKTKGDYPERGHGERLVVVDDDREIADMCKEGFEALGYEVAAFYSGVDALDHFKKNHGNIDLVVTDQTMLHMTGFELAREMLAIRDNIPVILCSGYTGDVTEKSVADAGIRRFVLKPVTVDDLSREIQQVLNVEDS
ncbi:MAG: response regulator [Desulfobacteraceae bacterium]|nr:response regulator [Desulfobacteraceae bacterium]